MPMKPPQPLDPKLVEEIEGLLTPLTEKYNALRAEEEELQQSLDGVRNNRRGIERILKLVKPGEPETNGASVTPKAKPKPRVKSRGISEAKMKPLIDTVKKHFPVGSEFTSSDLRAKNPKLADATIYPALRVLREEPVMGIKVVRVGRTVAEGKKVVLLKTVAAD